VVGTTRQSKWDDGDGLPSGRLSKLSKPRLGVGAPPPSTLLIVAGPCLSPCQNSVGKTQVPQGEGEFAWANGGGAREPAPRVASHPVRGRSEGAAGFRFLDPSVDSRFVPMI
jgi:hypothetical protein